MVLWLLGRDFALDNQNNIFKILFYYKMHDCFLPLQTTLTTQPCFIGLERQGDDTYKNTRLSMRVMKEWKPAGDTSHVLTLMLLQIP